MLYDTPMGEAVTQSMFRPEDKGRTFIVAVDFGTTFSSVAYTAYDSINHRRRITLQSIEVIKKYPKNPYANNDCNDVPTELCYFTGSQRPRPNIEEFARNTYTSDDSDSEDDNEQHSRNSHSKTPNVPQLLSSALASPNSVTWGYGVQKELKDTDYEAGDLRHLKRFKLILDDSPKTAELREQVFECCDALKEMKIIDSEIDIFTDFLDQLFRHVKLILTESGGYTEQSKVEFVLCVPAIWKGRACRQMQVAMAAAIKSSGLGKLENDVVDNLFIVSEPEAAAACVIAEEKARIKVGETFIMLDAGGGTVDTITYTVDKDIPLRLKSEVGISGGELCGSSFINERFEKLLWRRLRGATYLEQRGTTLSKIIDGLVVDFERWDKRNIDCMEGHETYFIIHIPGLKHDDKLRFLDGMMILNLKDINKIFQPSLDGVAHIMIEQLKKAKKQHHDVQKVILIGGFGQSHRLAEHLKRTLRDYCASSYKETELIVCHSSMLNAAVARGAVLRALRKEEGPARVLQSSFGFLRTELYRQFSEHEGQKPITDGVDGFDYIPNTIEWMINKGDQLKAEETFSREVEYTFALKKAKFICVEYLYVSDHVHDKHYGMNHPKNKGAENANKLEVNMSFLKEQGLIKPTPRVGGFPYWKVNFTLVIIVNGRNLRYEARWPNKHGQVLAVRQTPLAAAFRPGTE